MQVVFILQQICADIVCFYNITLTATFNSLQFFQTAVSLGELKNTAHRAVAQKSLSQNKCELL